MVGCRQQILSGSHGRGQIAMLVISPTRELAAQIAEEAKLLLKYQQLSVQVLYPAFLGGTFYSVNKQTDPGEVI
jgi:superfamily II DNA/RNA helicase